MSDHVYRRQYAVDEIRSVREEWERKKAELDPYRHGPLSDPGDIWRAMTTRLDVNAESWCAWMDMLDLRMRRAEKLVEDLADPRTTHERMQDAAVVVLLSILRTKVANEPDTISHIDRLIDRMGK